MIPTGKYLASSLQSGCAVNLTGARYNLFGKVEYGQTAKISTILYIGRGIKADSGSPTGADSGSGKNMPEMRYPFQYGRRDYAGSHPS